VEEEADHQDLPSCSLAEEACPGDLEEAEASLAAFLAADPAVAAACRVEADACPAEGGLGPKEEEDHPCPSGEEDPRPGNHAEAEACASRVGTAEEAACPVAAYPSGGPDSPTEGEDHPVVAAAAALEDRRTPAEGGGDPASSDLVGEEEASAEDRR